MAPRTNRNAIRRIFYATLATIALIVVNVFMVAIGKMHVRSGTDLTAYADSTNIVKETTKALRGNIYDRNGSTIAQDNRTYNIICVLDENRPSLEGQIAYVKDKEHTAEVLSKLLKMNYDKVLNYLNLDVYQTELGNDGRKIPKSIKDEIESYHLPGIEFTDSIQRVYPMGVFASNLVGYAQSDETGSTVGKMGMELFLNSWLMGHDGSRTYQVDKQGHILPGMKESVVSASDGDNVYLTLDATIQSALEQSFLMTKQRFKASRTWGAVMEVDTGKVLAWGQNPSFNPNELEIEDFNNFGAQLPYEPGSTLKTFTWASAINEGVYSDAPIYSGSTFCYGSDANNNPVRTTGEGYGCIANARHKDWGNTTYDHGLIYSSNTITASLLTEVINPDIHLDYLKRFGFFKAVDTDGIPEEVGILNHTWPGDKLALSYGQGSTVTMLQMLQAYSAVFTDGTMVKPYFVDSIRNGQDNTKIVYQAEPTVVGNPITEDTAKQLQEILYHVVNDDDGTAKFYQIPECKIIGKTGTTEVATNGVYGDRTITSLMAALPAHNPKVLVYYCFEADYNTEAHVETDAVVNILRKVAMTYNLTDEETSTPQEVDDKPKQNIITSQMPNVLNHSIEYAKEKLKSKDVEIYVLGEGSTVIDQFPRTTDYVTTGQRVFLLTDTNSFTVPDMKGWTRKDVSALWAVSGFGFQLEGDGKAVSQSVAPNTKVTKGTSIKVVFQE